MPCAQKNVGTTVGQLSEFIKAHFRNLGVCDTIGRAAMVLIAHRRHIRRDEETYDLEKAPSPDERAIAARRVIEEGQKALAKAIEDGAFPTASEAGFKVGEYVRLPENEDVGLIIDTDGGMIKDQVAVLWPNSQKFAYSYTSLILLEEDQEAA